MILFGLFATLISCLVCLAQNVVVPKYQTVLGAQTVTASEKTNLNLDILVYKGQDLGVWVQASNICDMTIRFDTPMIRANTTNTAALTTNVFLAGPDKGGQATWIWKIYTTNTVPWVAYTNLPNTLFAGSSFIRISYITNNLAAPLVITNIVAATYQSTL